MTHNEVPTVVSGEITAKSVELAISQAAAFKLRNQRDALLTASDWTQVADAPVDQAVWATYRQALRDVPDQAGFPDNVIWPVKP